MQLVTYLCFFHQRHLSFAEEGLLGEISRFGKPIGKSARPVRSYLPEISYKLQHLVESFFLVMRPNRTPFVIYVDHARQRVCDIKCLVWGPIIDDCPTHSLKCHVADMHLSLNSKCHLGNTAKLVSVRSSARIYTRELCVYILVKPDQVTNDRNHCFCFTQGSEIRPTQSATVLQGSDRQDGFLRWCRMGSGFTVPLSLVASSRLLVQRCGRPTCGIRDDREHNVLMRSFRRLTLDAAMQIC
jgi:hypothetical protein